MRIKPFQDLLARTGELESHLTRLVAEKAQLDAKTARTPPGNGRTLADRRRRAEVESRTDELVREISSVRLQLKRLGVK